MKLRWKIANTLIALLLVFSAWFIEQMYYGEWNKTAGFFSEDVYFLLSKKLAATGEVINCSLKAKGKECILYADGRQFYDNVYESCGRHRIANYCAAIILDRMAVQFEPYREIIYKTLADPCADDDFLAIYQKNRIDICPSKNRSLTVDEFHPDKVYIRLVINE